MVNGIKNKKEDRIKTPEELRALTNPPLENKFPPSKSSEPPEPPSLDPSLVQQGYIQDPDNPNQVIRPADPTGTGRLKETLTKETARRQQLSFAELQREAETGLTAQQEVELGALQQQQSQELQQIASQIDTAFELAPRMERLTAAGSVPLEQVQKVINRVLQQVGLGISDKTLKTRQREALKNPVTKILKVGVGTIGDIELFGFKLSDMYDDSDSIEGIIKEAKTIREMSEATLKGARDSRNYADGIRLYETYEGAIRRKYAVVMQLQRDDPESRKTGLNAADDLSRDINRVIQDRQILERALITGNSAELNNRIIEIEEE